jgi:RNA polymerase sigma-70 factor (ECF subfamily)
MSLVSLRSVPGKSVRGDAELLSLVAEGSLDAVGELYDRYALDIWRVAHRVLGEPEDVDDIVHTLFIQLPRVARSYDGRASCRGWLCGICVRLALRHRRGAGRFQRMLRAFAQIGFSGGAPASDPERHACNNEELAAFERGLSRLSDKKRAAFVLVEVEGLTTEEAADVLAIPAATVRTRLFHARRDLHEAMRGQGTT